MATSDATKFYLDSAIANYFKKLSENLLEHIPLRNVTLHVTAYSAVLQTGYFVSGLRIIHYFKGIYMCGIFAYVGNKQTAAQMTLEALKTLEYRGYDSWGVAALIESEENKIVVEKHIGKIGNATLNSQLSTLNSQIAIGHTRWATHGGVTDINAHPHLDEHGEYAVVQNGIVENYAELKSELLSKGHIFVSETDTEVIVHLIEELAKQLDFVEAVRQTFLRLRGLNAFVAMDKKTGDLVTVKNGSPLIIGKGDENDSYLASDSVALAPHTKTIYYVNDQEMIVFKRDGIGLFDVRDGNQKEIAWEQLLFDAKAAQLGEYKHFMIKEISEQPGVGQAVLATVIPEDFVAQTKGKKCWLVGCGTAGFAGFFGQYVLVNAGIDARYIPGSEFGSFIDLVSQDDIVIFLSQSGETIDLIEQVNVLKTRNVPILAIVNREGSTLARLATTVIYLHAGPEQCVLATKSFTAKIMVLLRLGSADTQETRSSIQKALESIQSLLSPTYRETVIRPIAARLAKTHDIFVIGRGLSYPLALEAALKIKEVTYLHAEGIAAGELKHGTIALIEQGTPCIVFAANDSHYAEIISNAMELKARGAYIIGIGEKAESCFDAHIQVPDCGSSSAVASIVPVQLLAYEMALLLARDPDKPRNLAKSVTVK